MSDTLTRRQRELLDTLRFRADLGTCWLRHGKRSDVRELWIPTMMADRHIEPLWSYNVRTIRSMVEAGLIEVGTHQLIPGKAMRWGYPISLTEVSRG